jgi:hypothetical protein
MNNQKQYTAIHLESTIRIRNVNGNNYLKQLQPAMEQAGFSCELKEVHPNIYDCSALEDDPYLGISVSCSASPSKKSNISKSDTIVFVYECDSLVTPRSLNKLQNLVSTLFNKEQETARYYFKIVFFTGNLSKKDVAKLWTDANKTKHGIATICKTGKMIRKIEHLPAKDINILKSYKSALKELRTS